MPGDGRTINVTGNACYIEYVENYKHAYIDPDDTQGCILVGENKLQGMVVDSRISAFHPSILPF